VGNLRFESRTIIVTGAASGIGLATAKKMAAEGGNLVLVDLNEDRLHSAREQIANEGARVEIVPCDVSNAEHVARAVEKAVTVFDRVDAVVNNAGVMIFKSLVDHSEGDWRKVLGVDLMGAFFFIQQAFRTMKNGGAIVNVSSVHAIETTPFVASYAAAKAALLSLTRTAALEGKPKGIRVNAVLPGAIDTPMLWENPNVKEGLEALQKSDVGKPEDIASAICFLASDEARFIQGAALRVDGGRLARL
jgi:NAD(P)-dependent dehydrogenase (short-subunit alcohol dehydrogenase family)